MESEIHSFILKRNFNAIDKSLLSNLNVHQFIHSDNQKLEVVVALTRLL